MYLKSESHVNDTGVHVKFIAGDSACAGYVSRNGQQFRDK